MLKRHLAAIVLLATLAACAKLPNSEQGHSVRTITPIFSQLLMLSLPKGFVPVFEKTHGDQYIHESVLEGQTLEKWTEMITKTGEKGLASDTGMDPRRFVAKIAFGFKRDCPNSFSLSGLGESKIDGYDAYMAIAGCGTASPGAQYSETALIIAIKGSNDYYTIQWAERGFPSKNPILYDDAKWKSRINKILPIRLCPFTPEEEAPYPSCANRWW